MNKKTLETAIKMNDTPVSYRLWLSEDLEFLREILEKLETRNYHDRDEAEQMLRDQIAAMEQRAI